MNETSVDATKPSDQKYLVRTTEAVRIPWRFREIRSSAETVNRAQTAKTLCIFVNEYGDLGHGK